MSLIDTGTFILIIGTMFSGKSSELIDQFNIKKRIVNWNCFYIKPNSDTRDPEGIVKTHDRKIQFNVYTIDSDKPTLIIDELTQHFNGKKLVVFIDEIQFFSSDIVSVIDQLLYSGCDIYAAGLISDYLGEPFETVSKLIPKTDYLIRKHAVCVHQYENGQICGRPAIYSQMFLDGQAVTEDINGRVHIGAKDEYKTFCREHYTHNPTKNHLKLKDEVCAVH